MNKTEKLQKKPYLNIGNKKINGRLSEIELLRIRRMIKDGVPYEEIQKNFKVSERTLGEINRGTRYYSSAEQYPLYKKKSKKDIAREEKEEWLKSIIHDLIFTNNTITEIASKHNCGKESISKINFGDTKTYIRYRYKYPLRQYKIYNKKMYYKK